MKIFKNKEYYRCEYCNKLYLTKQFCEAHESFCIHNPKNYDACLGCSHCKIINKDIEVWEEDEYSYDINSHYFYCEKHDKDMYPYIAKRKGLPNKYPDDFDYQEQMPNKCADCDSNIICSGDDDEELFNF